MYQYNAALIKVIDGDTVDLNIDLGFYTHIHVRCRIAHIDTPELNSSSTAVRAAANAAKNRLLFLTQHQPLVIRSMKAFAGDKFGRWLVDIVLPNGADVATILLQEGLAVAYEGGAKVEAA